MRAPLALTPAPAIAPPTVIPPAATRPTVSPSSLTPPNHPNNQPVSDRKCLQQLLLHSRINSITGEIFLATLAFISGLARSLKPIYFDIILAVLGLNLVPLLLDIVDF